MTTILSRAQGCLLGQLCGDALGSLVEFQTPEQIRRKYPEGVRDLADGGTWDTLAGQPTDDSELALALARTLSAERTYNVASVRQAYKAWLASGPFDCGMATRRGINGNPDPKTQANGALMRISPLGIFGAYHEISAVEEWARLDAAITHPHRVCGDCNALFVGAIAFAIKSGASATETFQQILRPLTRSAFKASCADASTKQLKRRQRISSLNRDGCRLSQCSLSAAARAFR